MLTHGAVVPDWISRGNIHDKVDITRAGCRRLISREEGIGTRHARARESGRHNAVVTEKAEVKLIADIGRRFVRCEDESAISNLDENGGRMGTGGQSQH